MASWSRMFTACLLHYNLDVPTAVRFVGNVHTGKHRDWNQLEPQLCQAEMGEPLIADMKRLMTQGCPNYVNAYSSEANRRAFAEYGNHSSVIENQALTIKAARKDFMRSHCLVASPLLGSFLPNVQLIPPGVVIKEHKPPRCVYDGSHHPTLDSIAINDMTSKETEHKLEFQHFFLNYLIWIYCLRITYPFLEIYLGDDDVSGAFRHAKWNPNVVGMQCFMLFGLLFFCTGLTFGGNNRPGNWEIIAICRKLLARFFWFKTDSYSKVEKYIPEKIQTAPPPTQEEINHFTPAERDSINTGVLNNVDDCLYANVGKFLLQTIAASILALYTILGFPGPGKGVRACVSWEKFTSTFTHKRHTLGWNLNSRDLTVSLPDNKRDRLIKIMDEVLADPKLTLLQIATLLGTLSHATYSWRHIQCSYFNLQRLLRTVLQHYYVSTRYYRLRKLSEAEIRAELPSNLMHRLQGVISRCMACVLWDSKKKYKLPSMCLRKLKNIRRSLLNEPWVIYIPQIIPRDHHFHAYGDASLVGGGAFSHSGNFWFRLVWNDEIKHCFTLSPKDPRFIHINTLEFLVSLVQAIAIVVLLESTNQPEAILQAFPGGLPAFPVFRNYTDNKAAKSWLNDARTTSPLVHALVDMFGQLLKRSPLTVKSDHLPSIDNKIADYISRPVSSPDLPLPSHSSINFQTFQRYPWMKDLRKFQPSQDLLSSLASALCHAT